MAKDGRRLLFLLNHSDQPAQVELPAGQQFHEHMGGRALAGALELSGFGVALLEPAEVR